MAFSVEDPEVDALARQVASLTGETLTEAVRRSLADRLRNEQIRRGRKPFDRKRIEAIIERFASLPIHDARSEDEILGYGEDGLPDIADDLAQAKRGLAL